MAVYALRWDDDWCLWIDSFLELFVSEGETGAEARYVIVSLQAM